MRNRVRLASMAALAMTGVLPIGSAGAATDPVTTLRTGIFCELQATPDGFEVAWDHSDIDGVSRVVVERQVLGRFWWRGRFVPEQTTFADGVAPTNAARAEYRVIAKNAAGAELDRADCELVPSDGLACTVTKNDDGYHVDIDDGELAAAADGDLDYVIRRSVDPGGTPYWRGRTDQASFDDVSGERSTVSYQVWVRADRRIIGGTPCRNDLANPACFTPLASLDEAEALAQSTFVDYQGDLIEQIDALVPGQPIERVIPFVDSRFIYTRDHDGLADLYVYDDRVQTNTLVAAGIAPIDDVLGYYVDAAGGVYANIGEEQGVGYWYFGPDGTSQRMTSEWGHADLIMPIGDLLDGRTVLIRLADSMEDWASAPLFARILVRAPATDDYTALSDLDAYSLLWVSTDGDLLLGKQGDLTTEYFRFDSSCIGD